MTNAGMESSSRADKLLATRRAEAISLLEANQRGRSRGSGILAIGFLTVATAGTVGMACHNADLAIPVPTVLLLLFAELCQYYSDVTVIGAARLQLERVVNSELGAPALIYETFVADIRKRAPLVLSERLLQAVGVLVVAASIALGAVVTYEGRPTWVKVLFPLCTGIALGVAGLSYRAMIASGLAAGTALAVLNAPQSSAD